MEKYDEFEFISRIYLPNIKRHPAGLNMECPFCNEGKSKGRKRRAFILTNKPDQNRFYCHNCGLDLSIRNFLQKYDYSLYQEYIQKERELKFKNFKEGDIQKKKSSVPKSIINNNKLRFFRLPDEHFISVAENESALSYCRERKIPKRIIDGLLYCPKKEDIPDKFRPLMEMVIFPFYKEDTMYGFQGRRISEKRFHTVSQEGYKVYNLFNVDLDSSVYILESIIDSFYVHNAIAMLGSAINLQIIKQLQKPVFVFDNDVSDDTIKRIEKCIELGYNVVLWPEEILEKDVNKMICNGYSEEEVNRIIKENIYSGFPARIRLGLIKSKKKRT